MKNKLKQINQVIIFWMIQLFILISILFITTSELYHVIKDTSDFWSAMIIVGREYLYAFILLYLFLVIIISYWCIYRDIFNNGKECGKNKGLNE